MSIDPDEFWRLLVASELLSKQEVDSLRYRIQQNESIRSSATKIAGLLVANDLLTETQASELLACRSVPTPPFTERSDSPPTVPPGIQTPPFPSRVAENPRGRLFVMLLLASLIGLPCLLLVVGSLWYMAPRPTTSQTNNPSITTSVINASPDHDGAVAAERFPHYELTDDNDALWARQQPGEPIQLRFAPRGVQAIVHLRLADLLAHPEGKKIVRSLGPNLQGRLSSWLDRVGVGQSSLQTLDLYLLPQGTTMPQVVAVGRLITGTTHATLPAFPDANEKRTSQLATDAIWFPAHDPQTFVFGPSDIVASIQNAGEPKLRRELEQLRLATHSTDHVTILTNPNFLRDEAQGLFPDSRRRLLDGLDDFWSDEAQAVFVGLQLSDIVVAEIRMIAREDLPARQFAAQLQRRVDAMPAQLRDFLGRVDLDKFWQPLAVRFPDMVRFVADQCRVAIEGKQVAVTTVLPAEAVHNLLLASELSLASQLNAVASPVDMDRSSWTLSEILKATTSVRFDQKSLEFAVRDITQQMRDELPGLPFDFTMEIIGTDLEPEGITRNQQIRDFDESNRPLADVLTSLVMQANPVQTVTDPSEQDQRLVWVALPKQSKIIITTRSAAEAKNLPLPISFSR